MEFAKKDHFLGKNVREHLAEEQTKSDASSQEGSYVRGSKESFLDSLRDGILILGAFFYVMRSFISHEQLFVSFVSFGGFFCFWRGFRAAIQAWTYLKRVHRIAYEERCSILANREQEREELLVLYQDKGFSGTLLNEVVDVLMADHERLLQVMLQEELGLKLISIDHPLYTALWAFVGSLVSLSLSWVTLLIPVATSWFFLALLAGICSSLLSYKEKNIRIRAFVWSTASAAVGFQALFALMEFLK